MPRSVETCDQRGVACPAWSDSSSLEIKHTATSPQILPMASKHDVSKDKGPVVTITKIDPRDEGCASWPSPGDAGLGLRFSLCGSR